MARNKVTKLWTAIVTALLALCTALGLITATASAAVSRTETTRNSKSAPDMTTQAASVRPWSPTSALPPTMKQRIRAEAHGGSPRCRHRPLAALTPDSASAPCSDDTTSPAAPRTGHLPLQR
ncbi:DUF6344 domain-containing protein [Streptomyces sp. NPDC058442]|uniref:DUF6344 domain-containing protein n=1 Tax=Streptomyces sp. NPDC058442 TaxID=3346503 RepID=UPI0036517E36